MRKVAIVVLVAFAVTLAAVVGNRMSTEAMAVVVGVVCGVAAGIPMSVLIMLVWNRAGRRAEEGNDWRYGQTGMRQGAYPPVVVIQGGTPAPANLLQPYYSMPAPAPEHVQRQFRVVGDRED